MSFNDKDENKGGLPPIMSSSLKKTAALGKPSGFFKSTGGIMERLKNLSKKDMAFVGIGMSVLVMAPVAEYLMSKPSSDNLLTPGFGGREQGIYEPGINGLSQGSTDGSGDVITPLSARDPMSLIMGPQAPMPPVVQAAPQTDLRDAMKDAGRSAFSAAAKSAGAPTPIPRMQGALRSVGSFFSGGESSRSAGSLSGDKIIQDAKSASNKAKARSSVGPVAMAGYKGVANVPNSASRGAYEKLRSQADKSAGNFNGQSAIGSLDKAASEALDLGRGGGGSGAGGESEKIRGGSNSNSKNEHNNSGETLARMAAKQRLQKALDWEFYKKYEIPKQIIGAAMDNIVVGGLIKPMGDVVNGSMSNLLGLNPPPPAKCWQPVVCPDGNCAQAVIQYKVKAPVDLCYKVGAQGFAWESAGKDKGAGAQANCICGKGSKPIGKEYQYDPNGGETPTTPGAPGTPTVTPPVVSTTITSGNTPEQISDIAGKLFADYDAVLQDMVNQTVVAEANMADPAKLEASARSVAGGFQNLSIKVNDAVLPLLNSAKTKAGADLNDYSGKVGKTQEKFTATQEKYHTFISQLAALEKDMAENKLKMKTQSGVTAVAETSTQAKLRAALDNWKEQGPPSLNTADGLLAAHRRGITNYAGQVTLVDGGIGSIRGKHAAANAVADEVIKEGEDGWPVKLQKLTGRLQEYVPAPTTPPVSYASNGLHDALNDADTAPPLKRAASGLRGLDWDVLWSEGHKFDSSKVAAAEKKAWDDWRNKIAMGQAAPILGQPDNFLSSYLRSVEIQQSVAGALPDLPNIEGFLSRTGNAMDITKQMVTGSGVDGCYFTEKGCYGVVTPPSPPESSTPPVTNNNNITVVSVTANADRVLGRYETVIISAQGRYDAAKAKARKYCTSKACKKALADSAAALKIMIAARAEIARLKAEAALPSTSSARLAEINARINLLEMDLGDANVAFNAAIREVERMEGIKPGGGGSTTPVTPPNTGITAVTVLMNADRILGRYDPLIFTAQSRYDAAKANARKRCTSKACKKALADSAAALKIMTDAKAEIARLKAEAALPATTAARLAEINARLGALEMDLGDANVAFNEAMREVERMEGIKPGGSGGGQTNPVTPPVNPVTPSQPGQSSLCYKTAAGCQTVRSFYLVQKWKVRPQKTLLIVATEAGSGAKSEAWAKLEAEYKGEYYTADRNKACEKVWDSTWLTLRALINFHGTESGVADCKTRWFDPVYRIDYNRAGTMSSGGDIAAIVAAKKAGNSSFKSYSGSAQSVFNVDLELTCQPVSSIWRTSNVSVRVDRPVMNTYSENFSFFVGAGPGSAGLGASTGKNVMMGYGTWYRIPELQGVLCGSDIDAKNKE